MVRESNIMDFLHVLVLTVPICVSHGEMMTSFKEGECKIPSQLYVDDYAILSNDVESGLECTIMSSYRQCEQVLYRKDTKMCVCTYTYDDGTPSMKDMTLINNMKTGLGDNLTRFISLNKNPVVEPCTNYDYTWIPSLHKCIKIISTEMNYEKAKQECSKSNGHLFVSSTRNITRALHRYLVCKGYTSQFWIGLDDIVVEKDFKWIDNTKFEYTAWGPDQPSVNPTDDCVRLVYDEEQKQYSWWDMICTYTYKVICEENN